MDFRLELVQVPVSDVDRAKAFDTEQAGNDDAGRPGFRFVFFSDPDGNGWAVQEIRPRKRESDSRTRFRMTLRRWGVMGVAMQGRRARS